METSVSSPARAARPIRRFATGAALVALTLLLTIQRLGDAPVCGANEAIEGIFLQQMVEHGAFFFPLENGREPMYKPPLFHWSAVAINRLAGIHKVTAFNLRLPSALFAAAGVGLASGFAGSALGYGGALLTGLIMAASYQYISQGRIGRVDMTLTFFEALALFSFLWWLRATQATAASHRRANALRYLFAAALGFAVLAKGPVGALMPLAAIALFILWERRADAARTLFSPGSALLAVGLASAWYGVSLYGAHYGLLAKQLGNENLGRFFGVLGAMPPWYYLKPLFLNSVPWSLVLPIAVAAALWTYKGEAGGGADSPRGVTAARLFAFFWLVTVIFFCIAAYKRRAYLLPLWPPGAVLIAWLLTRLAERAGRRVIWNGAAALSAIAIVLNFVFIPRQEIRQCGDDSIAALAEQIARLVGPDEPLFIYGADAESPSLLFYLDRPVPILKGQLGDAPPGYVIVSAVTWAAHKDEALDLQPVLEAGSGVRGLVLLHHGKLYAGGGDVVIAGFSDGSPAFLKRSAIL